MKRKKVIVPTIFILAMCVFASAQTPRAALDKVKEIKLLESDRDDVRRILVNYELDYEDDYSEEFSNDDADIEISYSSGSCEKSEDEEDDYYDVAKIWNVGEWKVTKIIVEPEEPITVEELGYDLSKFKKQKDFADRDLYYNKDSGVAFIDDEGRIDKIIFYPSKGSHSSLCDNEKAKKFSASENWFGTDELEIREPPNLPANVTDLVLSATEITPTCKIAGQNKDAPDKAYKISVKTVASDAENDVMTYNYEVSGGRIIGQGANVVWDLTGVKPGDYTITVGVDDGYGVCGTTKTQTVTVKECVKP